MAKKNTKPVEPEIEEQEIEIELYEINEHYGITKEGIVYDIEKDTALVPVLDDLGRPCVKIGKKKYPIEKLKEKYLPKDLGETVESTNNKLDNKTSHKIKIDGESYDSIEDAMIKLRVPKNIITAYLMKKKIKGGK